VAAYAVTPFNAIERAWKPFDPILGETFELEVGSGVKYLAEQVGEINGSLLSFMLYFCNWKFQLGVLAF